MPDIPPLLSVSNISSLASLLRIKPKSLSYLIYKVKNEDRYHIFEIPKKSGGARIIYAPDNRLKTIQRRLSKELLLVYPARTCVHGYVNGRNIRSNARYHLHKKWIINIDLKDFFQSIHFGRVRGLLQSEPFNYGQRLANEIANLCCYKNLLTQGASTSPILSNFICWRLDKELSLLASSCHCSFSRYADDITISTNTKDIPTEMGYIEEGSFKLSEKILDIIHSNGFTVNEEKVRFATNNNRQEVTGLVVNSKTTNVRRSYIRQVRAMLHACEEYGLPAASKEHYLRYKKVHLPTDPEKSFLSELQGKIGYIRYIKQYRKLDGTFYDAPLYDQLKNRLKKIYPESSLSASRVYLSEAERPILLGEGKTDWKYLKKALEYFQSINLF